MTAITVKEDKFDFFFGRVASSPANQARSLENLRALERLGVREQDGGRERLMQIFQEGLNAPEIDRKINKYGTTIRRVVVLENGTVSGEVWISYLYRDGDFASTPEITTLIPRIYK